MPFTLNAKLSGQIYTLLQNIFGKLLFAQKSYSVFVHYSVLKNPLLYYPLGSGFCYPILRKIFSFHLYLMGEVIFEVFFETFSKHLHLFGMGRGILQPQTKIFSSLIHKKMYSIKKYPLTLNAKKSREIWPYVKKSFKKICPFTYTQWERSYFKSFSENLGKKITPAESRRKIIIFKGW